MTGPGTDALREARALRRLRDGLAALLTLGAVAWSADLFRAAGLVLFTEQYLAGMLALALALVFVAAPARKGERRSVPWYDALAAVTGFASAGYIAVRYPDLLDRVYEIPFDGLVLGTVIVALTIEGLRRTTGGVLVVVVVAFLLLALLGEHVPGQLQGQPVAFDRLITFVAIDSNAMMGVPLIVSTTIVVTFVFFGRLLEASGGSAFFTDIALALMGRYRGGSAKIAVTASALFGSISGSAVSNVVSTGVITIPLMRQAGYTATSAGAIEAVASTGGQLMPPIMGAAAFLMAELLQIAYTEVVIAALIPAILYYVALFIQADLEAARDGIGRVQEAAIPRAAAVLRRGWPFLVPFAVLIAALFWLNLAPEEAALYGCAAVVLAGLAFGYEGVRMKATDALGAVASTGTAVLDIVMIGAAAGVIIGVLNISGLGFALTLAMAQVGQGNLPLLLVLAAGLCIVLGMGMPTVGVYLLLATLVAPALVEVGIDSIAAHLFVLYFGMMSMITPPVAIAAFAAASLARTDAMRTGYAAVRFGWSAYIVPFLFIAAPNLLMRGQPWTIAVAFLTAVAGIWLISAGIIGYLARPLDPVRRVLLAWAGLLLLVPDAAFAWTWWTDLAGLVIAIVLVWIEFAAARRARTTTGL